MAPIKIYKQTFGGEQPLAQIQQDADTEEEDKERSSKMESQRTLEKIVSPVRLGWHGLAGIGAGIALAYVNPGGYILGSALAGFGINLYVTSLQAFLRTSKSIKQHKKLDERMIEPHLFWYCNRQGARTAAANYGLASEFDEVMNNYQNIMMLRFIPHI